MQIALDIDRQRFERRDIERVQPLGRLLGQLADRRQEARQRLAGAGRRDQQRASSSPRELQHFELVAPRLPALGIEPAVNDRRKRASEVVGPVAPALFFLAINLARACFGAAVLAGSNARRITSQISTISRIAGPMISMIHH